MEPDSYRSDRVAFTPPGYLKRREWRPQSQPHDLQYHSVMPSHSSRWAAMTRPASMECWSVGVMRPWTTGITSREPHSGHRGVFLAREDSAADLCARFAVPRFDGVMEDIRAPGRNGGRLDAAER